MKVSKLKRLTIFGVEQTFKNKFWIILNVLMLLAAICYINFGTVKEIIEKKSGNEDKDNLNIMILDETGSLEKKINDLQNDKIIIKEYSESGVEEGNVLIEVFYDSENYIKVRITSSEYIDMKYYSLLENSVNEIRDEEFARRNNLNISEVEKVSSPVEIERVITTLDKELFEKYSGIFLGASLVVYMLFIFISSSLASTIGMEKVSRTTEYMLTGINENSYLWYNILQTNIVVLLQSALSVIYIVVATLINSVLKVSFLGAEIALTAEMSFNLNIESAALVAAIVYFVQAIFSVLILSIVQAVFSSRVSNISDVSNSTVLVLFFVIFATMIFPNLIPTGEAVNIFLKIISMLPVVSTVAVPKLYLLGQITNMGLVISIIVSIVSIVCLTIFGSKAFKKGLLSTSKGSKKEERVDKVKKEDFNGTKFKMSISKVSMALIIYLVVSNILGIIVKFTLANVTGEANYLIQIITWIVSIYPSYWYLKNSNYTKKVENVDKKKISVKRIILLLIIALGFVWGIQYICEKIDTSSTDITSLISLSYDSALDCILFVVYIALLPAIFEELLFRKAIYGSLRRYGFWIATIVSSFAFGIMHQNISQFIFAFLVGIVFCVVNEKSGTIHASMILHFINNSLAAIQMILINKIGEEKTLGIFEVINKVFIVWGVISVITFILMYLKGRKKIGSTDLQKQDGGEIITIQNPVKIIFSDFVTDMTLIIYVIITICVSKLI